MTGLLRLLLALAAILLLRRLFRSWLRAGRKRSAPGPDRPGEPRGQADRPGLDGRPRPLSEQPIEEAEYEELP